MTKTKIALAAVLFAATSSAAFAQGFDPNLANRYPGLTNPNAYGYSTSGALGTLQPAPAGAVQSAQVSLQTHRKADRQSDRVLQQRNVALPTTGDDAPHGGLFWYGLSGPTTGGM
jgi:hypothetical protein